MRSSRAGCGESVLGAESATLHRASLSHASMWQAAAACLGAAAAFEHTLPRDTYAALVASLLRSARPELQALSSALLSLARLKRLESFLWLQHCYTLKADLASVSGMSVCRHDCPLARQLSDFTHAQEPLQP